MMMFLDGLVSLLLLVTIVYALRLNRKIEHLQKGKEEFLAMVRQFDGAAMRAEKSIAQLKQLSQKANGELEGQMKAAASRVADLEYLIGRAETSGQALSHNFSRSGVKTLQAMAAPKQLARPTASTPTTGVTKPKNDNAPRYTSFANLTDDEIAGAPPAISSRREVGEILAKAKGSEKAEALESLMERIARHRNSYAQHYVTPAAANTRTAIASPVSPQASDDRVREDIIEALRAVRQGEYA
ncbi:MAG: hypothetical protein K0R63_1850 [Rickettsiales bacterium]|jgi:hypothetical protein|nr:hypothetical protein [Rickettsiales bacterium]